MKALFIAGIVALFGLTQAHDCPEKLQIACADDLRAGIPMCQKAAAAGGADPIADVKCMKYIGSIQKECWECICWFSEHEKVPIKGC